MSLCRCFAVSPCSALLALLASSCLLCPAPRVGGIKRRCASDVCLSVTYIGPKSRTERPRKTKIGTEVGNVRRDSDTTFKVKRSKVDLQGRGIFWRQLLHSLFLLLYFWHISLFFVLRESNQVHKWMECYLWLAGSILLSEQCSLWNIVGCARCSGVLPGCSSSIHIGQVKSTCLPAYHSSDICIHCYQC